MPVASGVAAAASSRNRRDNSAINAAVTAHFNNPASNLNSSARNFNTSIEDIKRKRAPGSDDFSDNVLHENSVPTSILGALSTPKQPSALDFSYSVEEEQSEDGLIRLRRKCGEIVDDERGQSVILLLIAVNSIMIGVATYPIIKEDPHKTKIFNTVDLAILVVFTMESILQVFSNGFRRFFKDGWLVFDLIIVLVSWISLEVDGLRAFTVFRVMRFVTRVSVLRNVVVALFSIVPAITAIFTLLLLIFYIFAVMFTTLFKNYYKDGYTSADYFGRLDLSLFTLFQILCLDEWSGIAYEITAVEYWSWIIFVVFVVMSAFVVVNLLIAVICDALQILRTAEDAMLEQKLYGQEAPEGEEPEHNEGGDLGNTSNDNLRERMNEMEKMLDDMVQTQETMARTIQYLSLALYAERKPTELLSIREIMSDDSAMKKLSIMG
ncbi:hypothetical protein ACHAWF_010406 [Thalassiosira exigua]